MKYLFIHQNFPGQFGSIASHLAKQKGNEVVALRFRKDAVDVPGVAIINYRLLNEPLEQQHLLLKETEAKVLRAEAVAEAAVRLKLNGWNPDVIIAHPGWGEAMYVKDVWPEARLVCYFEYFYNVKGQDFNFDPEFQDKSITGRAALKAKNAVMLQALQEADAGWTPSNWQKSTFPAWAQNKIDVINEGIDLKYFKPNSKANFSIENKGILLTAKDEVITYAARSLEPVRGFHVFMRALPTILKERPNAHVVIMGREKASYGPEPDGHSSWLQKLLKEVGNELDPARVHIVGFLPKDQYRAILQVSSAHVYLTYPFVLSWSAVEAQACGATLVASNTGPLLDAAPASDGRYLFDFFDKDDFLEKLYAVLTLKPKDKARIQKAALTWLGNKFGMQANLEVLADLFYAGTVTKPSTKATSPRVANKPKVNVASVTEKSTVAKKAVAKTKPAIKKAEPKVNSNPALKKAKASKKSSKSVPVEKKRTPVKGVKK